MLYDRGSKLKCTVNLVEFKKFFENIRLVMDVVRYRDFQYRLLHNKIFCNDILMHWGKVTSNICNLCHKEKQTILHLMYQCNVSQDMWQVLDKLLNKSELTYVIDECSIIFNTVFESNPRHVFNLLVLITTPYIFRCKCFDVKPNAIELQIEWRKAKDIDFYNAKINGGVGKVRRKWEPVLKYLGETFPNQD